jgi:hypothetical protein
MKLKIDANGNAVLVDGPNGKMPVYVHEDGKEAPFDASATLASIAARAEQSSRVETDNKELKLKLKAFADIKDPALALAALKTVEDLGHKKLVDAGEVDKVRSEVAKVYEERITVAARDNELLRNKLFDQVVGGEFSRSKTISDKFIIPADMVQARFGQHFGIDDDRLYATDNSGNRIYSRTNPGELAGFDEALMTLVDQYPYKEQILKGSGAAGSGAGNGGGGAGGKQTLTRAQFDALGVDERAKAAKEATLVD